MNRLRWPTNVFKAIEIDGGSPTAQDCVVHPQKIGAGTGTMILPTATSDSGVVVLGNRKLGSNGLARGIFVPPRSNTEFDALPDLGSDDVGYLLLDLTNAGLRIWDGSQWLFVQAV